MKAKSLSLAFFSFHLFFGIGTFQRVTTEKNEKVPAQVAFQSGKSATHSFPPAPGQLSKIPVSRIY
jgi:hypothetical protein